MTATNVITVEYDRDGDMVYAFEEDVNGDIVRDFNRKSDVIRLINKMNLIDTGRWDGETSGRLSKAYGYGRYSCHTGGDQEKYSRTVQEWDNASGGWVIKNA